MGLGAAGGSCKQSRAQGRKALGCDEVISLTGFSCPPNICAVTHLWKICEWVSLDLSLSQMGLYTAHITKPSDADLTELPASPSLYQRPRNVHMISPLPQTSFLLSFASRKCVGKRVWPGQKKKNKGEGGTKLQKENVEEMSPRVAWG